MCGEGGEEGGLTLHCHHQNDLTVNQPMSSRSSYSAVRCKVTRLCPQSHQTVSTKSPDCVHMSPDCVHKVTRLCPHVMTFCRRRQEAEAESNQGRSDNGPSALPLGQTGLRLITLPLVHLLNAQLFRSWPVERQVLAGTEIQIPRVSHPGYHHQNASHQDTGSGMSHSNVSFTVGRCRQMSHTQFTVAITRHL